MRATTRTLTRARQLRRTMTPPEVAPWQKLRGGRLGGLRFRRQHPLGSYILDFYRASARIAVELDGAGHDHPVQAAHDAQRTRWLETQGVQVLRFSPADVLDDRLAPATLEAILAAGSRS
jgi:very-short-patch-repair endonuclease